MNIVAFGVGTAAGLLYFAGLWWNTCLFAEGGRTATVVAVMVGRFAILGGLLTVASLNGAMPLLAMALGILVARFVVMRRVRTV